MIVLVRGGWVVLFLLENSLKPAENMPEIRFKALGLRLERVVSLGVV